MTLLVLIALVTTQQCASTPADPPSPPEPQTPVPVVILEPTRSLPDIRVEPPVSPPEPLPTPDSVRARQLLSVGRAIRNEPGGLGRSVTMFEEAAILHPSSVDILWELGWTYQLTSRWDAALDTWARLTELRPEHAGVERYAPIVEMRRDKMQSLSAGGPQRPETTARRGPRVTLAAVGDIQMGMGWPEDMQRLPPDSARSMFASVAATLRHPDVTFGNLETVLADTGESTKCRRGSGNCYAFRAPTPFARTLRNIGFDVMSTNNNHANDFGEFGLASTVSALESADIMPSGSHGRRASWETKGLRIALLAFSTGSGPNRVQEITAAADQVREADLHHDIVIVSFHAGAEGSEATRVPKREETAFGESRGDVYRFSRAMIDAGADLLLGHGPHVLRGMEIYQGRIIAYSLGNFAAWHGFNLRGPNGISGILEVTLAPNGVITDAILHPVIIEPPGVPRHDPDGRAIAVIRELSSLDFGSPLFDARGRLPDAGR